MASYLAPVAVTEDTGADTPVGFGFGSGSRVQCLGFRVWGLGVDIPIRGEDRNDGEKHANDY